MIGVLRWVWPARHYLHALQRWARLVMWCVFLVAPTVSCQRSCHHEAAVSGTGGMHQ